MAFNAGAIVGKMKLDMKGWTAGVRQVTGRDRKSLKQTMAANAASRRALGVALALTAVWLLSVLAVQVSDDAAYALAALVVALAAALVLARKGGR
ncbi:hypothetical protein LCGC14_2296200, partial [marine sediment metagenome]